jgi:pSer/pThr/pTyr-binding forkhead associated (FHA) protein
MKAQLVVQEGPGVGLWFPLDPSRQVLLSAGRSSDCNIVLADPRASRHHADFCWNGQRWQVVDRGSTNGTYVNGMQAYQPYDLRLGDRITIGETTLVLRDWEPAVAGSAGPARAKTSAPPGRRDARQASRQPSAESAPRRHPSGGILAAYWLAQGSVVLAIVSLASGAILPWLQITGTLSQDMEPLVKGISDLISSVIGQDFLFVTQNVSGLQGYGKLTLGIAALALIVLVVDLFVHQRSVVPGIIYTLAGLLASGAMAADLKNLYDIYSQVQAASLLFGIKLSDVIKVFDQFIEVEVVALPGLYWTAAGLGLLLVGGLGRLVVGLLRRDG